MSLDRSWRLSLFLMLMTASIVIANFHLYHVSNFQEQYADFRKLLNNVTRTYEQLKISHQNQLEYDFTASNSLRVPHLRHHHITHRGPYFENAEGQKINDSQNVAHLGDTALLDCRVVMLSGKMVMWIRQTPNRALLTVGKNTHISDSRYSVKFKYPNNWRLSISAIQKEDRGLYVCQVNTHPPQILITNVTILAPEIWIVDEANHELRDRYYKTGSTMELTCIARPSKSSSNIPHPVWKKNGEILPNRATVRYTNGTDNELLTHLRIDHTKISDGGQFSCTIGQFSTAMVNIHVLNGEKQAAVHHDQWNTGRPTKQQRIDEMLRNTLATLILLKISISYLL